MLNTEQESVKQYQLEVEQLAAKIAKTKSTIDRFSFSRVALLVLEILLFISLATAVAEWAIAIWSVLLVVPIVLFVIIVRKQNVLNKILTFQQNLLWVYQNEINVLNGLPNGYDHGVAFEDEQHAYLSDLDIFGTSSLYALINRGLSKIGREELAVHLSSAAEKNVILSRQAAITELAKDVKDTFIFRARLKGHELDKIEEIKHKLKHQLLAQVNFAFNKALQLYAKIIPYLISVLFLVALVFGGKFWSAVLIIAFANAMVTYFYSKQITQVYYGFSGSSNLLNSYADAIEWTEHKQWQSDYLQNLFTTNDKVSTHIKDLAKIIVAFDARLNFLLYAVLNFFFLWDIRCSIKLANWCKVAVDRVEGGLDRIGYFEELISLATLKYNHSKWVFPTIADEFTLEAQDLGHPLIASQNNVLNNYHLEKHPTIDIITGSNMAGKSTFLRTMGVNMVLAYAGAPVCASQMQLSIFRLLTYMRIKDNLIESTSTFKAELNRLKMILTEVAEHKNAFVFIDEMLRGTNSKDKFDGSKAFIEKLIGLKTPTLFATHDLLLSELENKYPAEVRNYHFDIQLIGGEMEFDYKIKHGPCTQFNAAILLRQIGLIID